MPSHSNFTVLIIRLNAEDVIGIRQFIDDCYDLMAFMVVGKWFVHLQARNLMPFSSSIG